VKRVLFVDDEVNVLQGLRRMLRSIRTDWEMVFVETAEAALAAFAEGPAFDVIVSDIQMPGMNGVDLLKRVMETYPDTIRFALSGHADARTMIAASTITHQFLTKPFDPQLLHDLLVRAFALREHLANTQLKKTLLELGGLPSLPVIYQQIMAEMQSPDPSVAKVAEIVSRDVAISAKVLQVVNSAYIGLRNRVVSVAQAASLLGMDNLRNLVLMAEVFSPLQEKTASRTVDMEALWNHSLTVGEYAMRIAHFEVEDHVIVYECFTAGLLHDIGLLILATKMPEALDKAFVRARHGRALLSDAEREYIGVTHAEAGGFLLELWGLPDPIVEGVLYHLSPSARPEVFYSTVRQDSFTALTAVHAANFICDNEVFGQAAVDADYLNRLELTTHLDTWWNLCHR